MKASAAMTPMTLARPVVPVEHLMSNFDEFYSEVV